VAQAAVQDTERLLQIRQAFDALAQGYDRSEENNETRRPFAGWGRFFVLELAKRALPPRV